MLIGALDPGAKGALALLDTETGQLETFPAGELWELVNILQMRRPGHVFIELVHAMPGQGVTSMFSFGRAYGELLGVLVALGVPTTRVSPQSWMRVIHVGAVGETTKSRSFSMAKALWPTHDWLASPRCRKPHDGMVDAALLAEFGRRQLLTS